MLNIACAYPFSTYFVFCGFIDKWHLLFKFSYLEKATNVCAVYERICLQVIKMDVIVT